MRGFAWSWVGAALQTTSLSFGTVNAPGDRYHPAIVAQAAATRTPAQFDAASKFVTPDDVAKAVRVSADLARHVAWLEDYIELGIDAVYLFSVNRNQREFIEAFAERVLPALVGQTHTRS